MCSALQLTCRDKSWSKQPRCISVFLMWLTLKANRNTGTFICHLVKHAEVSSLLEWLEVHRLKFRNVLFLNCFMTYQHRSIDCSTDHSAILCVCCHFTGCNVLLLWCTIIWSLHGAELFIVHPVLLTTCSAITGNHIKVTKPFKTMHQRNYSSDCPSLGLWWLAIFRSNILTTTALLNW